MCFICGCPRSGTTAFAKIINSHPDAAMGVERFKNVAIGANGRDFRPELFELARFTDIRETDTNLVSVNAHIAQKAAQGWPLKLIGDKIPRLYMRQKYLKDTFPDSMLIAMIRDPLRVALSWQARADNPKDNWPKKNGAIEAFQEWTKSLDAISGAKVTYGDKLVIINYDLFFGYSSFFELKNNIERLFKKIHLPSDEDICENSAKYVFRDPSLKLAGEEGVPVEYYDLVTQARAVLKNSKILEWAL